MVKTPAKPDTQKRKPRILWANPFCLLDTSSGASMTVRQMLLQLVASGYDVQVLGATVFDNPKGMGRLKEQFPDLSSQLHQLIKAEDGPLTHQLVVSYSHNRSHFTSHEEGLWYSQYLYMLDSFKPDVVWYFGGQTLEMLIANEARDRGIPVAFYLANGHYKAPNWCRDVDLILTDSQATADMYRKAVGYVAKPVGKFIAPESFIADHHERKRLLFVNPSWQKGASVFVQLAEKLERERPDIELEVVEARADWSAVLRETTQRMGKQRSALSNVTITANTSDMRGPYSRARVLVAPSLWWESSGRVLAEAMLNGIPALITNRGGMPEMIGNAGIAFDFPDTCYEEPYQHLLSEEELQPLVDTVINFFDDEALYQDYVARAWQVGKEKHHLNRATDRLLSALTPLVRLRAGNKDFTISQKKRHRQRLASQATKPEFKVDNSLQQLVSAKSGGQQSNETQANRWWLTDDFAWQFKGKVIVLDNRASLIKSGLADQMAATKAFGIVAFDPASEVKDAKQYEGSETIQVFQHALLGDGSAATLYACVAPEMTSTLIPLPAEKLPKRHHLGAKPLAELPISSIALDSINGLESLDWLILDELSDAMAILEHGEKSLTDTLLIQARVPFQLTHEKQPSLAELQYWASRNGFRFYRFHNISHHSHLPEELNARSPCATEQESADVLFLPSHERMAVLSDENKTKLAFILSTVFAAHDMAFDLIAEVSQEKALEFLEAQGFIPNKFGCSTSDEFLDLSVKKSEKKPINKVEPIVLEGNSLIKESCEEKKKFAVLMLSFGERPWLSETSEAAKKYAEKIGADFFLIQDVPSEEELFIPAFNSSIGRERKEVYAYKLYFPWKYLVCHGYDKVLLVDDSAVIGCDSPNIFSEVPVGVSGYAWSNPDEALISLAGISAWLRNDSSIAGQVIEAAEFFYRSTLFGKVDKKELSNSIKFKVGEEILDFDMQKYANTAVMVFDRSCADAISPEKISVASDLLYSAQPNQSLWWYLLTKYKCPVYKIDSKWNWLLGWGLSDQERRSLENIDSCVNSQEAYITHVTSAYGNREKLIKQLYNVMSLKSHNSITVRNEPTLYSQVLTRLISASKIVNIAQVGANDGKINDPIYDIVIGNRKKTKIALIEPQINLLPYLKDNYSSHPHAEIINCAVGRPGKLILYRVKPDFYKVFVRRYLKDSPDYRVPSGFASFDRSHVEKHVAGNIPVGVGFDDAIEALEIDTVNLGDVIRKLNWDNKVDVLQVDAEGMDDVVIYESNIDSYKPRLINFEHSHLSSSAYKALCVFLINAGYHVIKYSPSDTLATTEGEFI